MTSRETRKLVERENLRDDGSCGLCVSVNLFKIASGSSGERLNEVVKRS